MSRYLDPKTDIVFKKIFGSHPHLLKSFLNAVLPLPKNGLIEDLEYLSNEQVPAIPDFKYTVVDVRCTDQQGRTFIVEMQIQWTTGFMQRMLFNASKAYVSQLRRGEKYVLLEPVYGLGLINDRFDADDLQWYHHYTMVNLGNPAKRIKDLQLVFIELPKFKAQNFRDKKLRVLWLRFLSEIHHDTQKIPKEWLSCNELKEAIALAEEAGYSKGELELYDKYWDAISIEKTLLAGKLEEGREEGRKEGIEVGRLEGREEGRKAGISEGVSIGFEQAAETIAGRLLGMGMSDEEVASLSGLSVAQVKKLR